jgi:hypothetical protein
VHRHRRRAIGALVLLVLLVTGGCGDGDDDDEANDDFCAARVELGDRITELEGFQLTTEEDAPEARERVLALIDALRTMLAAAPEEIRVDADTMASGLDDIETRVEDATVVELGTEVPAILAEIGGAGSDELADAVAAVNTYAADTCD